MSNRGRNQIEVPSPDSYCSRCRSMTTTIEGLRALVSHQGFLHYTKNELHKSGTCCTLCAVVFNNCATKTIAETNQPLRFFLGHNSQDKDCADGIEHPLSGIETDVIWIRNSDGKSKLRLICSADENQPAAKFVTKRPVAQNVRSEFAFRKIANWLHECQNHHKKCVQQKLHPLPKRVLDLTSSDADAPVRLHVSGSHDEAEYAALSYCWGNPENAARTTRASLEARTKQISIAHLPKTIRDAIYITRQVGLRYLWVDALCILQDDEADKASQVDAMGSIYKNASVTIAASSSADVSEGFLEKRRLRDRRMKVPLLLPGQQLGSIYLNSMVYARDIESPLERRCWTLQEFVLSPRVLHYGVDELTWHCQSERFKQLTNNIIEYRFQSMERLPDAVFGSVDSRTHRTRSGQAAIWESLVTQYSKRRLTLSEDRLPALAGVARELAVAWNDTYLAGLWKECLLPLLCWHRREIHETAAPRDVRAPSWSWAAVMATVEFHKLTWFKAELVETTVNPVRPEAPFGQVDGGEIVLRGRLVQASQLQTSQRLYWMVYPDAKISQSNDAYFFTHSHSQAYDVFGDHFYFLLGGNGKRNNRNVQNHLGLILCATPEMKYKRVGLVYYCDADFWHGTPMTVARII